MSKLKILISKVRESDTDTATFTHILMHCLEWRYFYWIIFFLLLVWLLKKKKKKNRGPLVGTSLAFNQCQDSTGVARGQGDNCPPGRNSAPPSCPKWNYTLYRGLWRAAILSPSQPPAPAPPQPPLPPPHFEKSGYAPARQSTNSRTTSTTTWKKMDMG